MKERFIHLILNDSDGGYSWAFGKTTKTDQEIKEFCDNQVMEFIDEEYPDSWDSGLINELEKAGYLKLEVVDTIDINL